MRFVGDDQIKVSRRKELLVFVVEKQRLHGGDDNLRASPVSVLLVDHRLKVGGKHSRKGLLCLVLQLKAIHEKQDAPDIAGTEKELDDGGGGQGLASAGGHLEQEAVLAFANRGLDTVDGLELIGPEKAQLVGLDVAGALRFVCPSGLRLVVRPLGANDIILAHRVFDQTLRIGRDLLVAGDGVRRWKGGDEERVATLQIPEIVQVAVGENHEAAILRLGVLSCLLFTDEGILVLGLGFEDKERETPGIEQKKVNEPFCGLLEVVAERIQVGGLDRDAGFEANVCRFGAILEETPTS